MIPENVELWHSNAEWLFLYSKNRSLRIPVAIGGQLISVDLFDKPSTCQKVWDRLLTGVVFDALEVGATDQQVSITAV